MKLVFKIEKLYWTKHVKGKMRFYGLSESRLKRVLRKPDRKELGITPRTVAVMQKAGTKKRPTEIWLMYQKHKSITKIITAWRYPGISPKRQPPPIPENILWELKHDNFKVEIPEEYVKGKVKFLNCEIDLSKRVFIPRIETEFWVKKAIKEIKKTRNLEVLDMFAGSGCIGISILKNIKKSKVDFSDIDNRAVEQIKINLKLNKIPKKRYEIYQSDLFENLKNKTYHYIFANPPYGAENRISEVGQSVLKYEPHKAVFSGKHGLIHIKKFLKLAKKFLKEKGIIYLEFDPEQKSDIEKILKKEKYSSFKFTRDQFKKYRFARVIK
ncbi:MAG: HemK family protein methyltransferase [Patescibacteria group bacterium]|nr:HemK family protein methyltransferase [Patescibacteria group bacterium]